MHLSGTAKRAIAVLIVLQAGLLTTVLGAGGADATAGCEGVTGHLVDNSTTVTAVFHVPSTCAEVSVLSWLAPDATGGDPQHLVARKSADAVAPGDYRWTIAAPAAECFRQLDLRVPGRNVDSIVGGERLCSSSSPPPRPPSPTPPAPATQLGLPCTQWNVTAKSHEIVAGRYVQHLTLNATCLVTVVSFKATGPNWPNNGPQVLFDRWRGTLGPGAHTESVALPGCFFQADLAFFQADLVVNHRVLDTATGGTGPCATTSPRAPRSVAPLAVPTTVPAPPVTAPAIAPATVRPRPVAPQVASTAVAPLSVASPVQLSTPVQPSTTPTTTPAAVLGLVLTPPAGAAVPLPKTGGQQAGMAGVGLIGIVVGFGLLAAGRRRTRSRLHGLQR
jgi:LPXTG-motif cell wall-anchored protein